MTDSKSDQKPIQHLPEFDLSLAPKQLPEKYDYLAPDRSEIRLLASGSHGGLAHALLPADGVSIAVVHRTVEEIWYCLAGRGEMWRRFSDRETVDEISLGTSLTIPCGAHFQFRNTGDEPLEILIATMPPWPGANEAVKVPGKWEATHVVDQADSIE